MNKDNIRYLCNKLRKTRKDEFDIARWDLCMIPVLANSPKFSKRNTTCDNFLELSYSQYKIIFCIGRLQETLDFYGVETYSEVTPWRAAKRIQQYADGIIEIDGEIRNRIIP